MSSKFPGDSSKGMGIHPRRNVPRPVRPGSKTWRYPNPTPKQVSQNQGCAVIAVAFLGAVGAFLYSIGSIMVDLLT